MQLFEHLYSWILGIRPAKLVSRLFFYWSTPHQGFYRCFVNFWCTPNTLWGSLSLISFRYTQELNSLLKDYCQVKKMKFMETKHLFNTANGKRRNQYFVRPSGKIVDNCHLNEIGVSRLGKFLKYWTHSHLDK